MTSFTDGSRTGTGARFGVLGCAALMFVGAHLVLEGSARFAERYLDAYLWKEQDYLRLFSPANHVGRGRHRLLIYGASEARDDLLPVEIRQVALGLEPYQGSQVVSTLEDGLVSLQYIEGAYGRSAIPDAILLGITTRFVGNLRTGPPRLWEGIDKYSPHFRVETSSRPAVLVRRSWVESVRPRLTLLTLQPDRYRRGVFAIVTRTAAHVFPSLSAQPRVWDPISPSNYLVGKGESEEAVRRWLTTPGNEWDLVHHWDPDRDRERVTRELHMYRAFADRYGVELFVVNLPELSWNRELYKPGRYEAYLDVVRDALGETPFLDLRTFLPDDQFFDDAHATREGAIRVSREVGAFIQRHRAAVSTRNGR